MNPDILLSKRYSLLFSYLLLAIDEIEQKHTLEDLYASWKTTRPSRSAFVGLLTDFEHMGWITKVKGDKKSSRRLVVDGPAIRSALLLKEDTKVSESWMFSSGVFDFSVFRDAHPSRTEEAPQTTDDQVQGPIL